MHFSQITCLASFAVAALAAPAEKCKPLPPGGPGKTPTLPSTGSTDLPAPAGGLALKFITLGHGLQNYTCADSNSTATAIGALAVLYDITPLFSSPVYANITSATLWEQAIPLNLLNPQAAGPFISAAASAALSATDYQADPVNPFLPPADLSLGSGAQATQARFVGQHYFDAKGAPTFDLFASTDTLFLSGAKTGNVKAPTTADSGLLQTGAVDWLLLGDNGRGLSSGVTSVYRVVTGGGAAQACSVSGSSPVGQVFSVPYVAQYWFYG